MKILMLNVNGVSGSTGKIVSDIKTVLENKGHECLICYGANDKIEGNGYIRICSENERRINAAISRVSGILHGKFTNFSFNRFKKIVEDWNPDIVHIHCPNGYIIDLFKTLEFLAKSKIKTVLTNHAEYFYTGGCGYAYECEKWKTGCYKCSRMRSKIGLDVAKIEWHNFKSAFEMFDSNNLVITSVSPWVMNRAKQSLFFKRFRQKTVLNGIDTNVFRIRTVCEEVYNRIPKGKPIILHVTAFFTSKKDDIKGGYHIINMARLMPQYNFVIASSFKDNIENLPSNIYLWGRTKTQIELAELYNIADITVLTSQRETFSMIVAESLCCGTPVVGFKAGGPESISINEYTSFVDYGDLIGLKRKLEYYMNRNIDDKFQVEKSAFDKYSKEVMSNNYLIIYDSLLNA